MKWIFFFLPILFGFRPICFIESPNSSPTLINSVAFHPQKNIFCVTFTHHHCVGLYQINENEEVEMIQMLSNPRAQFNHPQNAIFSPDGNHLLVVNWTSLNFNIYSMNEQNTFSQTPQCVIPSHLKNTGYRPHGMSFSSDGTYLAVVYGSFEDAPWIVILYRVDELDGKQAKLVPCSSLEKWQNVSGVPKGVTFSPDDSSLLITFTVTNSVAIFPVDLTKGEIHSTPTQEITGPATQLNRPEDITFSPDSTYCAVSNSQEDSVSFYQFDPIKNCFLTHTPFQVLKENLFFPHGLGFSKDGKYFAITQFGRVHINPLGYITSWGEQRIEGITLFKVEDYTARN